MTDPIPNDYDMGRDSKRRRTVAPVLDGQSRGWDMRGSEGDEEDEEVMSQIDEQEEDEGGNDKWQAIAGEEYKSTNGLLRELHVLQQNKHTLSSSSPSPSTSPSLHTISQSNPTSPQYRGLNATPAKSFLPPLSEGPRTDLSHEYDHQGPADESVPDLGVQAVINEVQCVRERYEDTNKLVGKSLLIVSSS